MSIAYPLTLPTHTGFRALEIGAQTVVGMAASPFTGEQQVYQWPGQWWQFMVELPPMSQASAAIWAAFFLALNGPEGTFYMGPSIRKASGGTVGGTWTVGSGATANSTVLPVAGGTGELAVGDWVQVGATTAMKLHRVLQVNKSGGNMVSVDVFPRLRSAYANGTALTFTNPKGIFRLEGIPAEAYDSRKICRGLNFTALEAL
jgi:hypothetical protein